MADLKISELPAAAAPDGTEQVPVVQAGGTVRTTIAAIIASALDRANHTGSQAQSTVSGLVAALAGKADDSAVVKLTTGQIISGIKTFLSSPVVPNGSWTIAKTAGLQTALDAIPVDGSLVHDTGNETIAGIKTFSSPPVVPTPVAGTDAATKDYVDSVATATGVRVEDEGSTVLAVATGLNFAGSGVVVTDAGSGEATVTVGPFAIATTTGLQTALDGKDPLVLTVNTVAASGATETIPDVTTAQVSHVTLTADCTFTFPTAAAGKRFTLVLVQDGATPRLATWPAEAKWPAATAPTLSVGAGKVDQVRFLCSDGTTWAGTVDGLDIG